MLDTLFEQYKQSQKFSATSLSTYSDCPAKFYHRYIEHIRGERNENLHIGVCVHEAVESAAVQKRDRSKTISDLMEVAMNTYAEKFTDQNPDDPIVWKPKAGQTDKQREQELYLQGEKMVGEYIKSPAFASLDIKDTEQTYTVRIYPDHENGTMAITHEKDMREDGIKVDAIMDVTLSNHTLIDFKTSRYEWDEITFVSKIQFDLYAAVYRYVMSHPEEYPSKFTIEYESFGELITENIEPINPEADILFRADIITKHKTAPHIQTLKTMKTMEHERRLLKDIYGFIQGINYQLFPRHFDGMKCSWCDYREACLGIVKQ